MKEELHKYTFYLTNNNSIKLDFMSDSGAYNYAKNNENCIKATSPSGKTIYIKQ